MMHIYVTPLCALAVVLVNPQLAQAANNIGCLFSDTLCEKDREWCFDDQAFGHCLSDYGHYSGDDLYRYELGSEELRILEQEMQRLFLLGYRWSHTYTQCVLQTLLKSFRSQVEFDISTCNGDLDQDLEGALKAIEGEELVDPRDLAIVRFTPSVTDPHSDYADEVYFPPIREDMVSSHLDSSSDDLQHQDTSGKESGEGNDQQGMGQHQDSSSSSSAPSTQNGHQPPSPYHPGSSKLPQVMDTPHDDNNMANNYIQSYLDDDSDLSNDIYSQHYQPYAKRGYMDTSRSSDLDLSNYTPRLSSKNIFLTYGRDREPTNNRYPEDDHQTFEDQYLRTDDGDNRDELFGEEPTRPMYTEGGMQFVPQVESNRGLMDDDDDSSWSNMPEMYPGSSMSMPGYGGGMQDYRGRGRDYSGMRNLPSDLQDYGNLQSNLPGYGMRGQPDDYPRYQDMGGLQDDMGYGDLPRGNMRMPSNSLSGGYGGTRNPWNMPVTPRNMIGVPDVWDQQSLRAPMVADSSPWGYGRYTPRQSYPYQAPRRDPGLSRLLMEGYPSQNIPQQPPPSTQQQQQLQQPYQSAFGSQLNSLEGYDEDQRDYPDYGMLGDYSDYDQYDDGQFGRQRPFMQKFVKKDEETIGSDYGDLAALGPWSFQREERQDVKKPGPFYNSKNNYAFGTYEMHLLPDPYSQDIIPLMFPRVRPWQRARPLGLWSTGGPFQGLPIPRSLYPLLAPSEFARPPQPQPTEGEETKDEVPDLLLEEEKLVEEAAEDIESQSTGQPQITEEEVKEAKEGETKVEEEEEEGGGEKTDADGEGKEDTEEGKEEGKEGEEGGEEGPSPPSAPLAQRAPPPPGSFVTITTNDNLSGEGEGRRLAAAVLAEVGLKENQYDALSVEDDRVTFRVLENDLGLTAEDVAKKTVEMKDDLKQLGFEVEDAAVVQKSTVSAVVFNPAERHMVAAAVIVCGVMAALVVAAGTLFFVRRHARAKAKLPPYSSQDTEAKDYEDLCRARMAGKGGTGDGGGKTDAPGTTAPSSGHAPSGQRVSSLSRDSDNGNNSPSSRSSTSSCEEPVTSNMDISTGHMVLSYMEDHLKNKDRLEQEWIALCAYEADSCATTLALKPENNQKNRYPDAVPYDNNRVVLNAHANVNGSDYINASPITDHDPRNPTYIATQGPLEATAADFWQLVWEQGSVVVVMLSRLTENGHSLCHRYWPEEGSELYHIYEVHLVSEHIWCDDYLVRSFYLKNVRTGETRTVTQFHFLSWPDSGTPASTKALLEFRRKVNKSYRGRSCPIIVHCSDGIGRTGTYCLIDMVLNRMAKGAKEIDIAATLEHIRDQRPHMVRTKAQFEFVLMAVAEEVHAILKALPQ
ncbi:uncharacterized protein LOC126983235 isoform X2 [Eriocheir sinensis]|uniref:uncharacterized protein LOC126983235 isoform X2 n=1 Tax=Eriocheir sinensis TaxID=95602 RepID=UPI0021C5D320|nr:uncharacterized protein LOC126983235 isoform X2 [Eriocheir sinensis]